MTTENNQDPFNSDLLLTNYENCSGATLVFTSVNTNATVSFTAFLTDFDQAFSSQWNTEEVFGRMDPIANFRSTRRTISLSWVVPASYSEQAKTNLTNISTLVKMLYPTYAAESVMNSVDNSPQGAGQPAGNAIFQGSAHTQTLSRPPLIKIKYANLIEGLGGGGQLGWIENFTFRPNLDMGFFVVGKKMFPKSINLSCNFNVLHQQSLGFDSGSNFLGEKTFPFGKTK